MTATDLSNRNKNRKWALILGLMAGSVPFNVMAQQAVPTTAQPGVIMRSFDAEERQPSRLDGSVTVGEEQIQGNLSTKKIFTLQKVVLDNSSVYSQEQVSAVVAQYLQQSVSFADLAAIAQQVTLKYREDGYMFSSAVLSPQEIENGVVHLKVIEGRVTEVEVVGDYVDDNGLIRDMAAKIKSDGPTNTKDLERYLLLIDDLPGITARSLLEPSKTVGGGKLIITIAQDRFEGSVGVDNRGTKFLGPYRGTLVGSVNSLFGIHDRTTGRLILSSSTDELRFADLTHEEQIGSEGLRVKGRVAITDTEPGSTLDPLDLKGKSHLFDIEALYPLLRGRQTNVNLKAGFSALNSETDIVGIKVAEDHVRSLRIAGELDFTDSLAGVNQIELQATRGMDIFGATNDGLGRTRANGEHEFFRTNIDAERVQDLPGDFSAYVSISGQYSADPLLSSEEFALGGPGFGRAYDAGEITGDSGLSGLAELRFSQPVDSRYISSYQLFGYYDIGKVWNENIAVGEVKSASLASAGLGVRANAIYNTFLSLELDKPLTRNVASEGDEDPRVFFNVLKRF